MTYTTPPSEAPLDQPLYGATLPQAVQRFFKKYATFSGRASRSEYWWVTLAFIILYGVFGGIVGATGHLGSDGVFHVEGFGLVIAIIWVLVSLAVIVPSIALTVRRLHDGNFSGWLYLLHLIPSLGSLIVFILTLLPSKPEGARFDK